jgi:choline dehydrogenase
VPTETAVFDYVIVGAGSAGCVLANRLSADPTNRVCLLEAGGKDASILIKMPSGAAELFRDKGPHNWGFETVPQKHMDGRRLWWPRGKGWGGSSSINGMIYIRGHARDFDQWRQLGLPGWGYRDVLPYFKRSERLETGDDPWHGADGPLWVSHARSGHPLYRAFIKAGREAGHPSTQDFNGRQQEGMGPFQLTIKDGERWSASAAYLRPIVGGRPNLTVLSGAHTTRILIENGRAVGVEFAKGPGKAVQVVRAEREVVLSAGAVQSPQILLLSGIGPAEDLRGAGIKVALDSPDVGKNLQDHLDVTVIYECTQPITVYSGIKGWRRTAVGLDFLLRRRGIGRYNHLESGAFLKTRKELDRPDIQLQFVNAIMIDHARVQMERDGFTIHSCQLRPESRGEIRLASSDPFAAPLIDPNYLATENDRRTMRDGIRMSREIAARAALTPYRGAEIRPGTDKTSDADLDAFVRATGETIYHPVGTCRMGGDDRAVLDAELRVNGIAGLRVVDASAMPLLVGGNTNAATIMLAEKASDMILGLPALAPEDVPIAEDDAARAA